MPLTELIHYFNNRNREHYGAHPALSRNRRQCSNCSRCLSELSKKLSDRLLRLRIAEVSDAALSGR